MKAVLLVGGMGTRLRPLTYRLPKPLVPIMGKPLIMHVIDSLPREVDEIIVPMGYKKDMMEDYLVKNRSRRKITLVDEPTPMGTGGAVKNVEDYIEGLFLVINGDIIASLDMEKFVEYHRQKSGIATISLWPVDDPTPYGVAELDEEGRITRFFEKPKKEEAFSNLINAGAYALEEEVLGYIGKGFVSMERDVFPNLLEEGMFGLRFDGYWIDCGRRESILEAYWKLMGETTRTISNSAVTGGAVIKEPVVIDEGAVIAGATIGPRAYVSKRAVVGLRAEVQNSVILEDARVGARCMIVDSIIDSGFTVPDGTEAKSTILSNARAPEVG